MCSSPIDGIEYLRTLPLTIQLPKYDVILVHAGLLPNVELSKQPHVVQTKLRTFVKDETTKDPNTWIPYESNWKSRKPTKVKWDKSKR